MLELYCAACWLSIAMACYTDTPEDFIQWTLAIIGLIFAPIVIPAMWIKDNIL